MTGRKQARGSRDKGDPSIQAATCGPQHPMQAGMKIRHEQSHRRSAMEIDSGMLG